MCLYTRSSFHNTHPFKPWIRPIKTILLTDTHNPHARIMIRRLRIILHPRIHMHMLDLGPSSSDTLTHKHMVQRLAVHVVEVRVPLRGRDASDVVEVAQARGGEEVLQGRGEGKFVKVAGDEDLGVRGEGEEGGCEVLHISG